MNLFVTSSAIPSPCGLYRYRLTRSWEPLLPIAYWIMLNPSIADADQDDPTIRRCVLFSQLWGCGGIDVRNLFAYRATDPKELRKVADPIGPLNDSNHIGALAHVSGPTGPIVAAWGAGGAYLNRERVVVDMLTHIGLTLHCLGVSKKGHPLHPLYLASATKRRPFDAEEKKP